LREKEFAECAKIHPILVSYTCRTQKSAMNTCLRAHGTLAERDRAREAWFEAKRLKRQEEAEREKDKASRLDEGKKVWSLPAESWVAWVWKPSKGRDREGSKIS
jgi:hypothetical protein